MRGDYTHEGQGCLPAQATPNGVGYIPHRYSRVNFQFLHHPDRQVPGPWLTSNSIDGLPIGAPAATVAICEMPRSRQDVWRRGTRGSKQPNSSSVQLRGLVAALRAGEKHLKEGRVPI